uniref:Uncharacterized protein n=1 Tax=Oryza glumipatula TaxID=40148 RepID=A0A0E0BH59_9ORYZ
MVAATTTMTMTSGGRRLAIARRAECDYRNEGLETARSSGAGTLTGCRQVEPRGKSMGTAIDSEPTAIDLFNELHCSKTKGFSEPVKKAIVDMHAREALTSSSGPPSTNDSIWTGSDQSSLS